MCCKSNTSLSGLDEKIKIGMTSLSEALESQNPHDGIKEAELQVNTFQSYVPLNLMRVLHAEWAK